MATIHDTPPSGRAPAPASPAESGDAQGLTLIARAQTDPRAVLDEIAERAAQIVGNSAVSLRTVDPQRTHLLVAARSRGTAVPGTAVGDTQPLDQDHIATRVVREGRTVHVPDLTALSAESLSGMSAARNFAIRTVLAVPLLHRGEALGCFLLPRLEFRPFTADEIDQLEGLASRVAVPAYAAAYLWDLQNQLALQTEAADSLRAVAAASAPGDPLPLLDELLGRTLRLCGADAAVFYSRAHPGAPAIVRVMPPDAPLPVADPLPGAPPLSAEETLPEAALRLKRPLGASVERLRTDAGPRSQDIGDAGRAWGEALAAVGIGYCRYVPVARRGEALGLLAIHRSGRWTVSNQFTLQQFRLQETLADQIAIALENARLFTELQESNRALTEQKKQLTEVVEQQTATAEILRVIATRPTDLDGILLEIARSAARLCEADSAAVLETDGATYSTRVAAEGDRVTRGRQDGSPWPPVPITPTRLTGRAILERRTIAVGDIMGPDGEAVPDTVRRLRNAPAARTVGAMVATPLLRHGEAVGAIQALRRVARPFTTAQLALLETFASQAVIAMDNTRLFSELQDSNATLKEALEQQTATSDILKVIASSPDDSDRVMLTIAETACRLCGAYSGAVFRVEGNRLRRVASYAEHRGVRAVPTDGSQGSVYYPIARDNIPGFAVLEGRTDAIPDLAAVPESELPAPGPRQRGYRSLLRVPLLRDGAAIGAITMERLELRPFSPTEVALVETFAAQAVIAIENARLFQELRDRDDRRRQELERASAIQQRLLPSSIQGWPGVLEIAHRFRPAVETSGDFYDVLPLAPAPGAHLPPLQIAVGDVAGKGMSAALVTALARSALRTSVGVPIGMASPAGTLRTAGQRLHEDVGGAHFVACALAVVEPPGTLYRGPRLTLSNAAQVPVLLVRAGAATEVEPPGDRLPLGARPDGDYENTKLELRPGDTLIFSSDGLVEAPALPIVAAPPHLPPPDGPGELFGFPRLAASASHWAQHAPAAEAVAQGIWSDLTAWCGEDPHHDDMTLLVLRVPQTPHA